MNRLFGAMPTDAATLYRGSVMHARLKPVGHRFVYRVLNLLIDLDRLEEADRQSRLFAVNRRGLYSFHERDHGPRDGSSLSAYAREKAKAEGIDLTGGKVWLLCYPRLLGFVFNPLSIYYCYRSDGSLALLIYEVRNTFGETHSYVCPVKPGETSPAGLRQVRDKRFYVSPFIGMEMRYHFRLSPPGRQPESADSGDRPVRPPACRHLPRPTMGLDGSPPVGCILRSAIRDAEGGGGHPLRGGAALAERPAPSASPEPPPPIRRRSTAGRHHGAGDFGIGS